MKTALCLLAIASFVLAQPAHGQVAPPTASTVDAVKYAEVVKNAVTFLVEKGQNRENGSFSAEIGPGATALCVAALLDSGLPPEHEAVDKGLKYLLTFVREDGGIYAPDSVLRNYESSIAVMALARANAGGRYNDQIAKTTGYLKLLQWDDAEGHDQSSTFYGGQGYGNSQRPDCSNTSFFIEALKSSGESMDSTAMQNAVLFMSRAQNLESPHNTAEWAAKSNADDKGGFIYTPAGKGESKAGETPEGGLRSYASMTYTGLKSFLYAGVKGDDLRVQAARDWIRRHYSVDSNPGMDQQGLYYYYHVFAKALDANGERLMPDADGNLHNWRADLVEALAKRQQPDGSWVNPTDRWYEGDPNLVTAYSLLALHYCHPDAARDE